MSKNDLRKQLKQKLQQISQERRKASAQALFDHFAKTSGNILSFSSTPWEIDLTCLNALLAQSGRLFLPKIEGETLSIYRIRDIETDTQMHPFGFREPKEGCTKASLADIALILVPGLGFDAAHFRLGHGKGYYDRFLKNVSTTTCGVGFKEQLVHLPHETHDICLDTLSLF